eukprot:2816307-Ditylum_brightwellii.AAC.1
MLETREDTEDKCCDDLSDVLLDAPPDVTDDENSEVDNLEIDTKLSAEFCTLSSAFVSPS